jgi:hypothetical protein
MSQKYAAYNAQGVIIGYYDSVDSPVPTGINAVPITQAQWQSALSAIQGAYTVVNGIFTPPTPPTPAQLLATAQNAQATVVTTGCYATITGGFQSSALGAMFTYPSNNTTNHPDQSNLNASVTRALLASRKAGVWVADTQVAAGALVEDAAGDIYQCIVAGPTGAEAPEWPTEAGQIVNDGGAQWQLWSTPFWCENWAGEWAWMPHTAQQIVQVGEDGTAFVLAQQSQNASLQAQILTADSVAAVQAINWTPAP